MSDPSPTLTPAQVLLTFKFRVAPTRRQHIALCDLLESQRQLYNAALEERIDCYRKTGKIINFVSQCKSLTICRQSLPEMRTVPLDIQRGTLKRLDRAFDGFFARIRQGVRPGFPRFRGKAWFNSFDFREFSGIRVSGRRLRFAGMPGGLRVRFHREMPKGKILTGKFKRDHKGWSVCFVVSNEAAKKRIVGSAVGLDVGISTLVATSDGTLIPNPRVAQRAEKEMRRRQRQLARCRRGSNRRRKTKASLTMLHAKITNTPSSAKRPHIGAA